MDEKLRIDPVASSPRAFSLWLDFFRWVAAFAVVLDHCENRFMVPITTIQAGHRGALYYGFAFFAGFAHPAVMIFFVLSGYLVGGALWHEMRKNHTVRASHYLIKRISRLCIVLYPTFIAIIVMNLVGIYGFHGMSAGVYGHDILDRMRPQTLVCNVAFLQTAYCDTYGGDGALWSLFNEFWYYILWLLIMLGAAAKRDWQRILFFGIACATMIFLGVSQMAAAAIVPYMLIWLLGVAVAYLHKPLSRSSYLAAALLFLGLMATRLLIRKGFEDSNPGAMFLIDFVISGLFANLLLTIKFKHDLSSPLLGRFNTKLAAFSFSLYCIHIPVMNLYGSAMKRFTGSGWKMAPDTAQSWAIVFSSIALSVLAGYLFSRVTETHTGALRLFLSRVIQKTPARETPAHI